MDCIDEGLIQMYIDDEISGIQKKKIEYHIDACSKCKQKLDQQQHRALLIVNSINILAEKPQKIKDVVRQSSRRMLWKNLLYTVSAACAMLLGIIIIKYYVKTNETHPQIYYEVDWSVDANKPIADQEFMINIYNLTEVPSGTLIQ